MLHRYASLNKAKELVYVPVVYRSFRHFLRSSILGESVEITLQSYHHHLTNMQLGHLLNRSGLTCPGVSSMVSPGSLCLLACSCFIIQVFNLIKSNYKCLQSYCRYVSL